MTGGINAATTDTARGRGNTSVEDARNVCKGNFLYYTHMDIKTGFGALEFSVTASHFSTSVKNIYLRMHLE